MAERYHNCYVCGVATTRVDQYGIPLCGKCGPEAPPPAAVDKAPPLRVDRASMHGFDFNVRAWRDEHKCIACGSPRGGARTFTCGDKCWMSMPREVQRFLEDNVEAWRRG